jgi:hypothetical protein
MFRVEQNDVEKRLSEILSGKVDARTVNLKELRILMMVKNYRRVNLDEFFSGMISNLEADDS